MMAGPLAETAVRDKLANRLAHSPALQFEAPYSTGFLLDDMGFADRLPVV